MVQNSTYSLKLPTKPKQNPKPTLKQILSGVAASEHRPGAGQWPRLWFSSAVNIKLWLFFSYSCRLKFFLLVHLFKHLSQSHLLFPGTNWEEIILYYPLKKKAQTHSQLFECETLKHPHKNTWHLLVGCGGLSLVMCISLILNLQLILQLCIVAWFWRPCSWIISARQRKSLLSMFTCQKQLHFLCSPLLEQGSVQGVGQP